MKYFDWEKYINTYRDLRINGINNKEKAIEHYLKYGKKAKRIFFIKEKKKNKIKKIFFYNFWKRFNINNNYFTNLLKRFNKEFIISNDNPDIIFYSVFGSSNFKNKLIISNDIYYENVIFYNGESVSKTKKEFDKNAKLNLTFKIDNRYNNIRFPVWLLSFNNLKDFKDLKLTMHNKKKTDFCCFTYSNNVVNRNNFCLKLSKYKKVNCGGNCLNNIGYKVKNKINFQMKHKFCIAYENVKENGYTTEKIFDAYLSNCIPIYFGNEKIELDFNEETFINANNFPNEEKLIEYIKKVDNDEKLYNSYLNKNVFSKYWLEIFNDKEEKFFKNLVNKIYD